MIKHLNTLITILDEMYEDTLHFTIDDFGKGIFICGGKDRIETMAKEFGAATTISERGGDVFDKEISFTYNGWKLYSIFKEEDR